MKNVNTVGDKSKVHIDEGIHTEEKAFEKIVSYKNTEVAYIWCSTTKRLIEKPPS